MRPANFGCSFFSVHEQRTKPLESETPTEKKSKENNNFARYSYVRRNPRHSGYRKRMIKRQCLFEQSRPIIKKDNFSNLEILEMLKQINSELNPQEPNEKIEALSTLKKCHSTELKRRVIDIETSPPPIKQNEH